jgi:Site-specific recombinase XerD
VSIYKRGETWWVSITHLGQRVRQSTFTADKREAQRIHDRIKSELWENVRGGFSLNDALKIWLTERTRSDRDRSAIRVLLNHYPSRPVHEVTAHGISDALGNRKPATKNKTIAIVNAAINLAADRGLCEKSYLKKIPVQNKRLRFLTHDEWQRLYAVLPSHLQPICLFAISTGLRLENILGLRWQAVSLQNNALWVDSVDSKSRKAISIPLSDDAMNVLLEMHKQKNDDGYVFHYRGQPVGSIKKGWKAALVKAGIDVIDGKSTFRFHDLRHTWASWHVQKGTPLAVLKELDGWHSMDMVMRYAHLAPSHLREG